MQRTKPLIDSEGIHEEFQQDEQFIEADRWERVQSIIKEINKQNEEHERSLGGLEGVAEKENTIEELFDEKKYGSFPF